MISPVLAALRRSVRLATRRPRAALGTLVALASALFVVAGAALVVATIDRWVAAHPGRGGAMVIYLGDDSDDARARALVGELRGLGGVERVELVSAAESVTRLGRALGGDAALLDGVDVASLPASIEVALAPGVREVAALSPALRGLRGAPGVAGVVVEGGAEDRLTGTVRAARAIAWTGALIFAGLALLIGLAAARAGLAPAAREAAVLHLLGAPPGFAAVPGALAGALHGAAAAVLAAGALGLVIHGPGAGLGALAPASPSAAAWAGLVALGGLIGGLGGGLAGVVGAR